jgi:aspartate/methionine/tyrosine aminotransferase
MTTTFKWVTKLGILLLLATIPYEGMAEFNRPSGLNNRGQSKVRSALAKSYLQKGATNVQNSRTVVNIGSKRAGTCTMNIGATNGKKDKEVIVTAKDIINVCR